MNEQHFLDIVSGRRRGVVGAVARALLWCVQWPYGLAVAWRNRRFDTQPDAVTRVAVPVISIGNLTVGGTGKTPMVKWIARLQRQRGVRVAILSRGYGAEEGALNDEAIELEQALPDVPHLQDPDRVASARIAIEELETQLLLLDDGFQHRRLARDLDLVLLDATEPFGHGCLLPRGLLREPVRSLRRADVVCLTRADMMTPTEKSQLRTLVAQRAPDAQWCEANHLPSQLVNANQESAPLELLVGKRVAAFCGIGNPRAFHRTLESLAVTPIEWRVFPDHHAYGRSDIDRLASDFASADLVVCTLKDLAKVQSTHLGAAALWGVEVEMQLTEGRQELEDRLVAIAEQASRVAS